jgi:hypothetical protein
MRRIFASTHQTSASVEILYMDIIMDHIILQTAELRFEITLTNMTNIDETLNFRFSILCTFSHFVFAM